MIRYKYNDQVPVPAPFIHVTLHCPVTNQEVADIPALTDSGADRTVVPISLILGLGLAQIGEIAVAGFGGEESHCPVYLAEVAIRSLRPILVKVLGATGESYVLVGRDVLNHFRVVLDGPGQVVEIN